MDPVCKHHDCNTTDKVRNLIGERSHGWISTWTCEAHSDCMIKELQAKGYQTYYDKEIKCDKCNGSGKLLKGGLEE